jgi:hypothetical protein
MVIRYLRVFCVVFISLALTFLPVFAYADFAGWSVGTTATTGATTVYNATKQVVVNGVNTAVSSSAVVLPVAVEIGTMIARNVAIFAVSYAVVQLIGAGVQYFNDPTNKRFTYLPASAKLPANNAQAQYYYVLATSAQYGLPAFTCYAYDTADISTCGTLYGQHQKLIITASGSSQDLTNYYNNEGCVLGVGAFSTSGDNSAKCNSHNQVGSPITFTFGFNVNPSYNPLANPSPSTINSLTYDAVGSKILANANALNTNSQAVPYVKTVADTWQHPSAPMQIISSTVVFAQFEKNAAYPSTTTGTQTTTASSVTSTNASGVQTTTGTSTSTFNLPDFCKYATKLCNFLDFAKDDELPTNQDTSLPTVVPDLPTLDTNRVHFGAVCPTPVLIPINLGNLGSTNITFSYQPFCNVLSNLRPYVIGISYIIGALIIIGKR